MVVMTTRGREVVLVVALALAASLLTLAVVLAKPAQAQTSTDTDQSPFSFTVEGCTETVFVEGTFNSVAHTTTDANGGFHSKVRASFIGQGEGLSSGDKYVFHSAFNEARLDSPTGADFTFTQTSLFKIIRQGSDTTTDDQQGTFLNRITINAQGEETVRFLKFEFVCK
jgi:hypothetical protein